MSGIVTALATRAARSTNVRHAPVLTFDEFVLSFVGEGLVSYWKYQGTGDDEMAVSNATITGAPELGVPTIVDIDTIAEGTDTDGTVIAWPGTSGEYAQASHAAAHKTSSGTIISYFQRDTAAGIATLVMGDAAAAAGGFGVGLNADGSVFAYLRGAGGTPTSITGGAGDVQLDQAYCLIFKWGSGGLSLALWDHDGNQIRRITNTGMTAGLTGSSAIRFGATHADTNHHDGPYGRVVWFDRAISTDEEALFGVRARSIARSASAYRQLELSMGPLALWGMGDDGGSAILDAVGSRHGSYAGVVAFNAADLPTNSTDGAANFSGLGTGIVPHDAGLSLPLFTLSFWVRANTVPGEGDPDIPLISKDTAGINSPGDFVVFIVDEGSLVARFRDGVTNHDIGTPPGTILPGQAYHICIRAGTAGFRMFVNGTLFGPSTAWTGAWVANTQPILFASNPFFSLDGDIVLDEVALYPRILSDAEVFQLAQREGPPVAAGDAASVPESATTAIDVLTNDDFVGTPTLEIVSQPAGGDSAAVSGQQINYTAGSVASDTARSFTYRITDANGTSNTVTVNVTVLNVGGPAPSFANCFTINTADPVTIPAGNTTALVNAINAAPAGRTILLSAGTYEAGAATLNPSGTAANPIVVRPLGARGSVTINNLNWTLAAGSSRIVFANLFFNNARFFVNGSNHRITRCQFRGVTGGYGVRVNAATDTRVDHCDWSDFASNTNTKGCLVLSNADIGNGSLRRVLFDYNYIHDIIVAADAEDGSNFVRTVSTNNCWRIDAGLVIDHCLIRNTSSPNHGEFIVIKVAGAIVRFCTFESVRGYLQQRQGGGWEVRSNWFENNAALTPQLDQAPLKCWDMFNGGTQSGAGRQLVIGNRLVGSLRMWIGAGTAGDVDQLVPNEYHRSRLGRFIGNNVGGGIRVGEMWSNRVATEPALNNNLFNNTGTVTNVFQEGTTFNSDSESFTPAVKLAPSDVGLNAPDPLCPSGPQS